MSSPPSPSPPPPSLTLPSQNTTLSLSARLLCYLGPPSALLLTAAASPQTALLTPFVCLPTAYFYRKWQAANKTNPSHRGRLEPMLWTFAGTGTLGLTCVAIVQIAICKAASGILFSGDSTTNTQFWKEFGRTTMEGLTPTELAVRSTLASSWQNWAFNAALCFLGAGLCEELLKFLPCLITRRRDDPAKGDKRKRAYLDYALAASLSFSLVEGTGFIYGAVTGGNESWPTFIFTLIERLVIAQAGHLTVGVLTALRGIRRDYYGDKMSFWQVVGPSVLFHGVADYVCFSASALDGNVGWIHPRRNDLFYGLLTTYTGIFTTAAYWAKREWDELKRRDGEIKSAEAGEGGKERLM